MNNCQYFFENTRFANSSKSVYYSWLENPVNSTVFITSPISRSLANSYTYYNAGVRPAIEVVKSQIDY